MLQLSKTLEFEELKNFICKKFSKTTFNKIIKEFEIYAINNNNVKEFYLVNRKYSLFSKIISNLKNVVFLGTPFVYSSNNRFNFHPAAVEILNNFVDSKIKINDKAVNLFLYGRDIFKNSVIKLPSRFRKGEYCVVIDERNQPLGLGELLYSKTVFKKIKEDAVILRNIVDLGVYLRVERE
ncbi:MAG: PUA domain-containing protein [Candidatus Odinarchaeia archaeon]